MKVSSPFLFRKFGMAALGVLTLSFMPEIFLTIAQDIYSKKFFEDVVESLENTVNQHPYCLIVPRKVEQSGYSYREWIVINDPLDIDLEHVLDHAIREKLFFYAKEGRSIKERSEFGREMHFGIALRNRFFIWSFRNGSFVELRHPEPISYVEELKRKYNATNKPDYPREFVEHLHPNDYYCPLSHY